MKRHSVWLATRTSALYLLGAALFVFLYSALSLGLEMLPFSDSIKDNLAEAGVRWADFPQNLPYQLAIHVAAGFLFGALVTIYAVLSWPIIAIFGASRSILRTMTIIYVAVVFLNLFLFTVLVVTG